MPTSNLSFFATPGEQLGWLEDVLADPNIWGLVDTGSPARFQRLTKEFLRNVELSGREYSVVIFLGQVELANVPVFETTPGRLHIDFARSRCIQLVPSMQQGEFIIEGNLAILRPSEYDRSRIDAVPILKWFRELSKAFERRLGKAGVRLITTGPGGSRSRSPRRVLVSQGVVDLAKQGKRLKQFLGSSIEFELDFETPA
jgi:hypothetical protein